MRPGIVQRLKHGKILCQRVYPFLVDTFNWFGEVISHVRGDGDISPDGFIEYDRTDEAWPVIRFRADKLKRYLDNDDRGCWYILGKEDNGSVIYVTFGNTYCRIGGRMREFPSSTMATISRTEWSLVTIKEAATRPAVPDGGIEALPHLEVFTKSNDGDAVYEMRKREKDLDYYYHPLYLFHGGEVECDFRNIVKFQMYEDDEV